MTGERGQAHTLEGFAAAVVLLGGVLFALQATAVTPLTASTSNQHVENQQAATAESLLAAAEANGTLTPSLLYWNTSSGGFEGGDERGLYANGGPPTAFGVTLNRTFSADRIAFNVIVRFADGTGGRDSVRMVYMGTPSDNAVAATRSVVVYDDDRLVGGETLADAAANDSFYAPDAAPTSPLFTVLEVRIVVWRI